MTSVFRRFPALNIFVRLLRPYDDCYELIHGLGSLGLTQASTSWHTAAGVAHLSLCRSLGVMANCESSAIRHLDPKGSHIDHTSTTDQPLQQGVADAPALPQQTPTGFKKTFYKRKLPSPPATEFSSASGRQLFQEALMEGYMVGFFKLMEQFHTQDEPAFCGLASLTMVLNALSIDPRRTWKGSWRWFHEAMLDCCRPLDIVKKEGITLYQASCLARCNGARVELRPYGSTSLEQFRSDVQAVCRSGEEHIVVSYSRKTFLQTGDGHFSPIGGYHRERDLVLVLDVARFKYPPHWVPLPMLYDAMSYIDPETGRSRGYMRLASNPLMDSVLLTLDLRTDGWRPADCFIRLEAPALVQSLAAQGELTAEDIVRRIVDVIPLFSLDAFLVVRSGAPLAASGPGAGDLAATCPEGSKSADSSLRPRAVSDGLDLAVNSPSASCTGAPSSLVDVPDINAPGVMLPTAWAAEHGTSPQEEHQQDGARVGAAKKPCSTGGTDTASSTKPSCGSCGFSGDVATSGPGGGCGSINSRLMAAAAAVLTAQDRCIPMAQRQQVLDELRSMPLYSLVSSHLATVTSEIPAAAERQPAAKLLLQPSRVPALPEYLAEKVTMALLMQRLDVWPAPEQWQLPEAGRQWWALLGPGGYSVVEAEAAYLREQLLHIDEVLQSGDMSSTCGEHASRLDCAAHGH